MLGGEDKTLHTCKLAELCPLTAVESFGIEKLGVLIAVAPLGIGLGVDAVMNECIEFRFLPFDLSFAGHNRSRIFNVIGSVSHFNPPFFR